MWAIPQPNQVEKLTVTAIVSQGDILHVTDTWTPKKFMRHLKDICSGNPRQPPTFLSAQSLDSPRKHGDQKRVSINPRQCGFTDSPSKSTPLTVEKKRGDSIGSAPRTLSLLKEARLIQKTTLESKFIWVFPTGL